MASSSGLRTCPNCNAALVPGRAQCISCGLAADKMEALAAAKAHAARRGIRRTATETATDAPEGLTIRKLATRAAIAVVLLVAVVVGWTLIAGEDPRPWLAYPTDGEQLVSTFMAHVAAGDKDQAYTLVSTPRKNPDDREDADRWGFLFQDINEYLAGEFGSGWNTKMSVRPSDPAAGGADTLYVVTVGTETLHVEVEPQLPPSGKGPTPAHQGVVAIREFPMEDSGVNVTRGAQSILRNVYGADGSAEQVGALGGIFSGRANESAMQTKRRVLPLVRNPRSTGLKHAMLHLWPVRQDPTVRARLTSITTDARYAPELQKLAQDIMDSNVPEEELIAARVPGL